MSGTNPAQSGHFTAASLEFLTQLRKHNQRDWFLANKARFEAEVRDPFLRLIADLAPGLRKIHSSFIADPAPHGGSMMRIYRDTRFSKDKSPYKTHVAAHFGHARGKEGGTPGYYLHIEPGASMVGAGVWHPDPAALRKIRDHIVADPKGWTRATSAKQFGTGSSMGGESLTRPPAGYDKNHPLIEDIKRRDFVVGWPLSDEEVRGPKFDSLVLARFRAAAPLIRFLCAGLGLP
ncbi:MAG TPA: DUF2461 domain-containing protein [Verrucomicrobiae bacterium]|nr:DUF2461 domain-containing protein [Verrucomicrobiae bacterium]